MKTPKVASAMNNIDDELITATEKTKTRKHGNIVRIMSLVATFAIVLCAGLMAIPMIGAFAETSTVAIDVNPSIEIEVNRKDKVVEANALNADAEAILEGLDLEKKDVNEAISAIVEKMFAEGKLSAEQNALLLSVDAKNEKKAEALKQNALARINEVFGVVGAEGEEITPAIIIQNYKKNDKKNENQNENCSDAKAALIEKVVAAGLNDADGVAYTAEQLQAMNMHEIMLLLGEKKLEVKDCNKHGKANKDAFVTEEEVVAFVYTEAGVTAEQITGKVEVEMDFFKGGIVYEVEFVIDGVEYEYEVNAKKDKMFVVGMEIGNGDNGEDSEELPADAVVITEAEAVANAKAHAGVAAEIEAEAELDGKVYEVEFKYEGCEYEYEIDAVSGKVVGVDIDRDIDIGKHEGGRPEEERPGQWEHHGFGFKDDDGDDRFEDDDKECDDKDEHKPMAPEQGPMAPDQNHMNPEHKPMAPENPPAA